MRRQIQLGRWIGVFSVMLLSIAGCSVEIPEPTPSVNEAPPPTETTVPATRPMATDVPPPTSTPTAEPPLPVLPTATPAAGYYQNPELGFALFYPSQWDVETTGGDFPSAIIYDNDDPLQLFVGAQLLSEETSLEQFAADLGATFAISGTTVLENVETALNDGTPAREVTLSWTPSESDFELSARGLATLANGKGYAILLIARPDVLASRTQTFETIASGLTLSQPELYGVPRGEGLVRLVEEPVTLDPALTTEGAAGVVGHIFSGLVRLDESLQIVPDLAAEWSVSEDGTIYTFILHDNLTFHDETPLTADDVAESWLRATDPRLASVGAARFLSDIQGVTARLNGESETIGVDVIDSLTLQVTLDGPKPYFLQKLTQPAAFVVDVDDTKRGSELNPWWRLPNGSGPFMLRRWADGEVFLLDAFEDYPAPPQIPTLIYLPFGTTGLSLFEANVADVVEVAPFNLARVRNPADPLSPRVVESPTFCTSMILFNLADPAVEDLAVRSALLTALDRTLLADIVAQKGAIPAESILPPGMPGYQGALLSDSVNEFDLSTVGELSLAIGADGGSDPLVDAMIDQWRSHLGIEVVVQQRSVVDHIASVHRGDFPAMALWQDCADYPDPERLLDQPFGTDSPVNWGGYSNPTVDDLLDEARTASDPAVRIENYQEAERLILADAAIIPLIHPIRVTLVREDISGYSQPTIPVMWPMSATLQRQP